jgi:T-complex protein 1 subunit delta
MGKGCKKIVAYANTADTIDLKNIRIIKKQGGTVEYSEMVDGLVLNQTQD